MIVRRARADDDAALTALMERITMPGRIRLGSGCLPSFFGALRVEGSDPVVCVVEDAEGIAGVGAATFRKVFLNGRVATLRYLSALRGLPRIRGSLALARSFARMRMELEEHPADVTLSSILSDNEAALRVLTSGRAGMPPYEAVADCVTRVISVQHAARKDSGRAIEVVAGADAGEIAGFLTRHGASRDFFPACVEADLGGGPDSRFPGLSAGDFMVAKSGAEILGVLACWNVMPFRQTRVAGYTGGLRFARPMINPVAGLLGWPPLPPAGHALRIMFGALPLVAGGDPEVFRALVRASVRESSRRGFDYFVMTLAADDRWHGAFDGFRSREIQSRVFRVLFEAAPVGFPADGRQKHFEAAML